MDSQLNLSHIKLKAQDKLSQFVKEEIDLVLELGEISYLQARLHTIYIILCLLTSLSGLSRRQFSL